jgi:putative ABC transport system ATP-binding protein/macrolide transport system ATP-binding/permease protein/lipoprotein-releasing system ATP-binding protein
MKLSATGLVKRYRADPDYLAVDGADLEVDCGEFIAIIGRSGSGKSTLLAMLGALTRPSEGQVFIDGRDLWSFSETQLAAFRATQIGFVFQFPSLLPNLRAVDNVALPALLAGTMTAGAANAAALRLLDRVGLRDRSYSAPGQLSGGEQRRVVIARALINSPRFLLADEPTSDLDEDTEADIIDLLDRIRKRESIGLIVVAHDLRVAQRADRVLQMRQGLLAPTDLPEPDYAVFSMVRHFGAPAVCLDLEPEEEPAENLETATLGNGFWQMAGNALAIMAVLFLVVMAANYGASRYQQMRLQRAREEKAALETLALNRLRGDVQAIRDLGDGRYELTLYLWNTSGGKPIYVMSSGVQAYVQVDTNWEEVALQPFDQTANAVLEITGKQMYRYGFEARLSRYSQLLPNYMHIRFVNNMLVSPQSTPNDDLFERKDNYYVYLKPWNADDKAILTSMRFDGAPPVWIPMPPH